MTEKTLQHITVWYNCSDELASLILDQFDVESNSGKLYCLNVLINEFIDFSNIRQQYESIVYINLSDIRRIYNIPYFNQWMECVDEFDEIIELFDQVKEYREHIQHKVTVVEVYIPEGDLDDELWDLRSSLIRDDKEIFKSANMGREWSMVIGDHTIFHNSKPQAYTNHNLINEEVLRVGRFSVFGESVFFMVNRNHNYHNTSMGIDPGVLGKRVQPEDWNGFLRKGDIVVGNDVWVGSHTIICAGITIGDGAVVGTGSVVTSDVPPYAIVAGNPAKIIKYRFDTDTIRRFLDIAWWNWPIWKVYDNIMLFNQPPEILFDKIDKKQL